MLQARSSGACVDGDRQATNAYLQWNGCAVYMQVSEGDQVDETTDTAGVNKELHVAIVA